MRKSILVGLMAAALGGSAAAYPPMPVFNGTFAGVEVPMPPSAGGGGSFYGSGSAGATAVTVYYSPWYNAGDLDLSDPADVAKLKDLVRVQVVVGNGQAETWEYDGPALATWNIQFGEVNGATYNSEKQGPNGGLGMFANCVISLIAE